MPTSRGAFIPALVGCLIVGGTAYQTWRFDQTTTDLRANEERLTRQYSSLAVGVADLRAAQAGYVASGQGPAGWMARFDDVAAQIDAVLADRQRVGRPDAVPALSAAQNRLEALRTSDRRARNYVTNDQLLLASDVIFVESFEILGLLDAEVGTARDTEVALNRLEASTIREYQLALAGSALIVLLGLILVASRRRQPAVETSQVAEGTLTIRPRETPLPKRETPSPSPSPASSTAWSDAADVCVDLARLLDGRDLPSLLSRAATAIGARGIVLWALDEGGTTLRASLAHGYSDRTVQKLGTLPRDADNVTSTACRTLQPQVMAATTTDGSGALAVPLVGTAGCVGVLSAEVTGAARDGSTLPMARIIAAQLAAIISPVPAAVPVTAGVEGPPPVAEAR